MHERIDNLLRSDSVQYLGNNGKRDEARDKSDSFLRTYNTLCLVNFGKLGVGGEDYLLLPQRTAESDAGVELQQLPGVELLQLPGLELLQLPGFELLQFPFADVVLQ